MDELNSIMLGGDAFITKPYNPAILLAKIAALLKKAYRSTQTEIYMWKEVSRPRQHRHLKRKNSILFLVFLDFPHFFIHSGWQDTLF